MAAGTVSIPCRCLFEPPWPTCSSRRSTRFSMAMAACKVIETLVELDIAREITGRRRNRLFTYVAYLAILSEDPEPL
jgi:hypothetical protein